MTRLEGCIRFWKSKLESNRFLLEPATDAQIEATIRFLEELQKLGGGKDATENKTG